MKTYFPDSQCVTDYLERQELENAYNSWKCIVTYLEKNPSISSSPELKKQLTALKNKNKATIIRQSRNIRKVPRYKARIMLRFIKLCPWFAEYFYVFMTKLLDRKNHV